MPKRSNEEGYYYTKANLANTTDRYCLVIKDSSFGTGIKKIIFHSTKTKAGIVAKQEYEKYIAQRLKTSRKKEKRDISRPKTVKDACEVFSKRRAEGRKETCGARWLKDVNGRFKNHLIPFMGKKELAKLTVEDMFSYKKKLQSKGLSDKTVLYAINETKELFSYCVELGWIERTPFDSTFRMAKPKGKRKKNIGNLELMRKTLIQGWKNPIFHAVTLLCFFTGMRCSELKALSKDSFEKYYNHSDCEDCVIVHINKSFDSSNHLKSPKNGRTRIALIPRWAYEFISPVMDFSDTELAFSNNKGITPFSEKRLIANFRKAIANANNMSFDDVLESGIVFHSVRALFNSLMTGELAGDIRRSILGWTSENVAVEHYFSVLPVHYPKILNAQRLLFDEQQVNWFKVNNILDLSESMQIKK